MISPNKPAAPNAGIAPRFAIGHHWPGVGEPGRSASFAFLHEGSYYGFEFQNVTGVVTDS